MEGSKPKAVEELIDFYFHRRLALPVVRLAARIGLTPNQVTWLSLFAGCLSAYFFSHNLYPLGSLALLLAIVLDCSDGMLARITGVSSPIGRILDGFFDAIWVTLIWVAIYRNGPFHVSSQFLFLLMLFSGSSMLLHCWTYDGVKNTYLSLVEPHFSEKNLPWQEAQHRAKVSFHNHHYFESLLYFLMFLHHSIFVRNDSDPLKPRLRDISEAQTILEKPMRYWSFLGEGLHLALMYLAGLITPFYEHAMLIAFAVILIPLNMTWIVAAFLWFRAKQAVLGECDKEIANAS